MSEKRREHITRETQLAYTDDFKKYVKEHKGFLTIGRKLIEGMLVSEAESGQMGNVKVERVSGGSAQSFKVSTLDAAFFVKVEDMVEFHGAYREFKSNEKAQQAISNTPDVEIIPALLGYTDKDHEYFIAPWRENVINLSDTLRNPRVNVLTEEEKKYFEKVYRDISERYLLDFTETYMSNMFFDTKRRKILVFDLHRMQDERE